MHCSEKTSSFPLKFYWTKLENSIHVWQQEKSEVPEKVISRIFQLLDETHEEVMKDIETSAHQTPENHSLERAGVPVFLSECLTYVNDESDASLLLPVYKESFSVYASYLNFCQDRTLDSVGKVKFGRELNLFLKRQFGDSGETLKIKQTRHLFLKNFKLKKQS